MQKIKKVFLSLIIFCIVSITIPFHISALSTYYVPTLNNCVTLFYRVYNNTYTYQNIELISGSDIRIVSLQASDPSGSGTTYIVSQSTFNYYQGTSSNGACSVGSSSSSASSQWVNGVRYYYMAFVINGQSSYEYLLGDGKIIDSDRSLTRAVYYTFGEGASYGPDLGDLQNVGFYTKFTNSQQSNISQMALNMDVITWDNYQDTKGNDLNDINLRVDIQSAVVDYSANTKSDLLNQTINDMLTGTWTDLITISPNVGEYSFTWETVARALFGSNYTTNWWNNLFNVFDSAQGVFYKKGWIYRIRLRTADNSYVGDWQIIYNITSAPPSDSEKVYNNYYVYNYQIPDEETYRVINNINNINNTTNNWYHNDVPFNPDSGSNWFEKLLEFISELIQKILDFFSSIFDGLVDLILGLFGDINPADSFFNWFSNLFNGIGEIDLTLPEFNLPNADLTSFNRLVQETLNIFSFNNFGFVIFIPLLLIIIKAVF